MNIQKENRKILSLRFVGNKLYWGSFGKDTIYWKRMDKAKRLFAQALILEEKIKSFFCDGNIDNRTI